MLALAALAVAGPAAALTPPLPRCELRSLSSEEAAFSGYDYVMFGDGFAYYERRALDGTRWEYILEHCPTRDRLTVGIDWQGAGEDQQRINDVTGPLHEAITSDRRYTLQDLRDIARAAGAEASVDRTQGTSCVCADMGY
jgi:hypothetical protein